MIYFLKFMGWAILYSLFYFLSLDITGIPPGHESPGFHKIFNYGILLIVSIPVWWFTWKKFEKAFGPKKPQVSGEGAAVYFFSLRNPALMYYLMLLKMFLLALGANGIITLGYHHGASRVFWISNFFVLYIYAIPFFIYKLKKLLKARSARVIINDKKITLQMDKKIITEISFKSIESLIVEESPLGFLIDGGGSMIYIGGPGSGASSFYINGAGEIYKKLKGACGSGLRTVDSIKDELKKISFKPFI